MTTLDLRVGALSLLGNPGTSRTLRLIFTADGEPVTPGPVSVWIGGDERSPNDFTGAVEHVAAVAGNEATVTVPIPDSRELLRVTIDSALATIGTVAPSLYGTVDQDQTVSVNLGAVEVHLDLAAVPIDLEQRLAGKQDADPALDELSGINVEEWGRSWLAIADAAAARAELGLGAAATMSPVEVVTDPDAHAALSGAFAALNAGREGTGMPEGVVSAPVGTVYRDLAATNGAVVWVKASGSGNTGWRVVWGDTGWRALLTWDASGTLSGPDGGWDNLAPLSGTAGGIFIRRTPLEVQLRLAGISFTANASHFGTLIPAGWRSDQSASSSLMMTDRSWRRVTRPGFTYAVGISGQSIDASGSITRWQPETLAWPTSLPGTAA